MFGLPWYVFALVAAVLVAAVSVMEKQELKREHSLEYVVVLSVFNLIVAAFLWPWVQFQISWAMLGWIYLASILGALSLWFIAKALRHLDVSVVAPQTALSAVFALIFAFIFLGERMTLMQSLGVIILIGGALLLNRNALHHSAFSHHGVLVSGSKQKSSGLHFYQAIIIAAMVFLGATSVIDKHILNTLDVFTFTFYIHVCLAINHLVIFGVVNGGYKTLPRGLDKAGWLIVIIAVATILSRLAVAEALALASVALVIPIKRMSAVFATLVGGQMFKEKGLWLRLVISIAMIVGVWLLVR